MKIRMLPLYAAVLAAAVSVQAHAITLDYRHEVTDVDSVNKDRFMISDRFASGLGYSVETKVKSGGDREDELYGDMESNGSEFSVTYQFKPADELNFTLQPGVNAEFGDDKAIYKPLLRMQYTFDNGVYVAFRYRYEYTRNSKEGADDEHCHRYEGWLGYRTGPYRAEFNYIWRDSDQVRYDNKDTDYEYDFKLSYDISKNWTPYIQVGNIKVSSASEDRQTRFRIGIQYKY